MIWFGPGDPMMRLDAGLVWRTTRTPEGPATYRAQATDEGIHLSVWGEGCDWIIEHSGGTARVRMF